MTPDTYKQFRDWLQIERALSRATTGVYCVYVRKIVAACAPFGTSEDIANIQAHIDTLKNSNIRTTARSAWRAFVVWAETQGVHLPTLPLLQHDERVSSEKQERQTIAAVQERLRAPLTSLTNMGRIPLIVLAHATIETLNRSNPDVWLIADTRHVGYYYEVLPDFVTPVLRWGYGDDVPDRGPLIPQLPGAAIAMSITAMRRICTY